MESRCNAPSKSMGKRPSCVKKQSEQVAQHTRDERFQTGIV